MRPRTENDADDSETEASEEEATDEEAPATEQRRGRLLKNENGYYVIDAHAINKLLDEPIHRSLAADPYRGATRFFGTTPQPPGV